jgi:hypothetical protein
VALMAFTIPPLRITDKPLEFRSFLGSDHIAEVDGLRVGWILDAESPEGRPRWLWTMTGPCCGHARVNNIGECSTLEAAKLELRKAFEDWKAWAGEQREPVTWFE